MLRGAQVGALAPKAAAAADDKKKDRPVRSAKYNERTSAEIIRSQTSVIWLSVIEGSPSL
jgi:hypothetical protein